MTPRARSNPESHAGSLVWWMHVPTSAQNDLQAILEGYDDLGYYQTFPARVGQNARGEAMSLARLTTSIDAEREARALLDALAREIHVELPDDAPSFGPSEQPEP